MDISRRAAIRTALFGLHAGAVFAGTECLLMWRAFRWAPAATVGGVAYALGAVLSLLAYPRTFARTTRTILLRGLRVFVYSAALLVIGALLIQRGAHAPAFVGRRAGLG